MKMLSESLDHFSHLKVGNHCDLLHFPENYDDIQQTYQMNPHCHIFPLGGGSNVLFGKVKNTVILSDRYLPWKFTIEDDVVQVSANHNINYILKKLVAYNLGGLEFLAGIPAHVGGLSYMNAGAYGKCIGDYLLWIKLIDHEGIKVIHKEQLNLGYRYSGVSGFIVEVALKLEKDDKDSILNKIQEHIQSRKEKQPLNMPNLGCFFKNPEGLSAGKLIDQLGFKGFRIGDAMVSQQHANFLVNVGNAKYKDFESLILTLQNKIFKEFGFYLELEVKVINES